MKLHWGVRAAGTGLCFSLLASGTATAATFTFTKIADTSNTFSNFLPNPSINDAGTVAFTANLDSGGRGIFTGTGGAITPIALSNAANGGNPVISGLYSDPSINNVGTVAFGAITTSSNRETIFTASGRPGEPHTTITDIAYGAPVINDLGTVAFVAFVPPPVSPLFDLPSILVSNGGTITTVVSSSQTKAAVSSLALSNTGTLAFSEGLSTYLSGPDAGVFTVDSTGGPITTVVRGAVYGNGPVSINRSGTIAGRVSSNAGHSEIFTVSRSGGPLTTVVSGGFSFAPGILTQVDTPSINDNGTVAFSAVLRGESGQGIFIGPDPEADKVIATGDSLFGSTVESFRSFNGQDIGFSTRGLNNRGQIAFYAQLADGTSGIFRADPVTVPESSFSVFDAFWLSAFGASAMLKRHREGV